MGTEKDIFGKALPYGMGKKGQSKYDLSEGDDAPSLDFKDFLSKVKTGKHSFDAYVGYLLERKGKPKSEDTSRIDEFLRKNTGMDYEQFVNSARPEEIKENSYGLFKKQSIKRSLFKSKSRAYLEALCDVEEKGENIQGVLDDIRERYIPTLKKHEGKEPTFEAIYAILKKS